MALFPIHDDCQCGVTLRHSEQEVMIWFAAYCENLLIWMDLSEILLDEQEKNRCLYRCCCLLVSIDIRQSNILDLENLLNQIWITYHSGFFLSLHLGSRFLKVFITVLEELCSFKGVQYRFSCWGLSKTIIFTLCGFQ